jgi:dUTP pyrophosphatase
MSYPKSLEERVSLLEFLAEEQQRQPVVKFKKLHPDAKIPRYQTDGAAGMDVVACNDEPITLWPGAVQVIPLGFAIELPDGYEAQVRPRSGLSLKGISVANSPGTIDSDYRGVNGVILRNMGDMTIIHKGDRIAQFVIARVAHAEIVEVEELSETSRGAGGFGSTGTK